MDNRVGPGRHGGVLIPPPSHLLLNFLPPPRIFPINTRQDDTYHWNSPLIHYIVGDDNVWEHERSKRWMNFRNVVYKEAESIQSALPYSYIPRVSFICTICFLFLQISIPFSLCYNQYN